MAVPGFLHLIQLFMDHSHEAECQTFIVKRDIGIKYTYLNIAPEQVHILVQECTS